jgi:hypothetical protein
VIPLEELIARAHRLAAARAAGTAAPMAAPDAPEAIARRARAEAAGARGAALSPQDEARRSAAARQAAEKLKRKHRGAQVKVERLRAGWGLAATVKSGLAHGGHETVAGSVAEVCEWLDLTSEARRLAREHPGAAVRVVQDAAGSWVLRAAQGDDTAEGAVTLVGEWLSRKDPAAEAGRPMAAAGASPQARPVQPRPDRGSLFAAGECALGGC